MAHSHANHPALLARIRRLKGQVEAIERALEAKAPCGDILNLAVSVRGAFNGLVGELIADHIRNHVCDPATDPDGDRAQGAAELIDIVGRYLK